MKSIMKMLDISIPSLEKTLKNETLIREFCMKHIVVTEKFDGTKLTLIRNKLPRDNEDYSRNWVVSYKGNRIFAEEFIGVTDDMIQNSIGVCQYNRVFDHLRKVATNIDCDSGTEFFIEFIQNKPTLTRDYCTFGDLYLIAASTGVRYVELGMRVVSVDGIPASFSLEKVARWFGFKRPPVLWEGKVQTILNYKQMCKSFSDFTSVLGGQAEGVVITTEKGEFYKIVAADQYDKAVRKAKKMRYALAEPAETDYWKRMKAQAISVVKGHIGTDMSTEQSLAEISKEVYEFEDEWFSASNSKKHIVVKKDDLMLTCKMELEMTNELINVDSVGVIPMAGRPVHSGHWCLIEKALQCSDVVYLFVSLKDRGEGSGRISSGNMLKIWKELLLPALDKRVIVRFCDSPVLDANRFVRSTSLSNEHMKFTFFGDHADTVTRWNDSFLEKTFSDLVEQRRIDVFGVSREDTVQVSGTEMRKWLEERDRDKFVMHLPQVLTYTQRAYYYDVLSDRPSELMTCPM